MPKYVCKAKGRQRIRKTGKPLVSVVSRSAAGIKAAGVISRGQTPHARLLLGRAGRMKDLLCVCVCVHHMFAQMSGVLQR